MDDPDPSTTPGNDPIQSPVESSSDELAAGSDREEVERRRATWSALTPKRPYRRSRSFSGSESPDELAMDANDYWRSRDRARSLSQEMSVQGEGEEERGSDYDEEYRPLEDDRTEPDDAQSDRSLTPVPPPPPPRPEEINYKQKFLLKGHQRGVSAVRFSPDCSMIASGGADATVKLWDTATGKLIMTFEGHLAGISTIAWMPDGRYIASGSDDKTIRLWSVETFKGHPRAFVGHHNYVYQIAFSPKGNILVSGSYDEAVFLWDVRSARIMKSLPAHSDPVSGIDVVWDGTLIASCATDGLIRIWDTATGQCLRTLVHEDNPPVVAVKFSPNGKYVLAWSLDHCVRLWNYVESRVIKTYQGHVNQKYSMVGGFGYYGPATAKPPMVFAVSGSEDSSIVCWDVVNKNILQRIEGHEDVVLGIDTCSFKGKRLMASCSLDKTVRVWEEVDETESEKTEQQAAEPEPLEAQAQSAATAAVKDVEMTEAPTPTPIPTPAADKMEE